MKRLLSLATVVMLLPLAASASVVWKGNFETGNLSQWTEVWAVSPDRMQVVNEPVREGNKALKVTVSKGDDPVNASGNRNELFYASYEPQDTEYYYKWSTLFPQDFPRSPKWQVFTQWHHDGCCGSPPMEFYVLNDVIHMRVGGSSGQVLWTTPLQREQWNDFVLHAKWSPDPKVGFVELYHNGKLVVPKRNVATRYPGMAGYIQYGYYRDESIEQTASLYHDGFVMATTLEEVMPSPSEAPAPVGQATPPQVVDAQPSTPASPPSGAVGAGPQAAPSVSPVAETLPGSDALADEAPAGCGASATGGAPVLALGGLGLLAAIRRRKAARSHAAARR